MEWLFRSEFDTATLIALWSTAAVVVTTVVLFVYTIGLRAVTVRADARRAKFVAEWRDVFASATLSASAAESIELPAIASANRVDLLEEWNLARSIVLGDAAANLVVLAKRAGIPELADELFERVRLRSKILGVQTLGNLRAANRRDDIRALVDSENTVLSITAAAALAEIDPDLAAKVLIPMIVQRRDWPKNRLSLVLRLLGSNRISEPIYREIRKARDDEKTYLLQFVRSVDAEALDALVVDLLRTSKDPGVLTTALTLVSGFQGVPRLAALARHPIWYVRMQAAKVLGRIGDEEHVSLLVALLSDPQWWVRYRAAQAIVSLPFLGPNRLRRLQKDCTDAFAADILQQAFAEVGLA